MIGTYVLTEASARPPRHYQILAFGVFSSIPPTEYGPHLWGIIKASLVNMGMPRFVRTNSHLWPVLCMDELGNMVAARRLQTRETNSLR
jgi:hypothetical protein